MERKARFKIGHVHQSKAVDRSVVQADVDAAIKMHRCGEWGMMHPKMCFENEEALRNGRTITSYHIDRNGIVFVIATNEERDFTSVWTYSEGEEESSACSPATVRPTPGLNCSTESNQTRRVWFGAEPATALGRWWRDLKADLWTALFFEAPTEGVFGSLVDICEEQADLIETYDRGNIADAHPSEVLACSLSIVKGYVTTVKQGPVLETKIGRWLFSYLRARYFASCGLRLS